MLHWPAQYFFLFFEGTSNFNDDFRLEDDGISPDYLPEKIVSTKKMFVTGINCYILGVTIRVADTITYFLDKHNCLHSAPLTK